MQYMEIEIEPTDIAKRKSMVDWCYENIGIQYKTSPTILKRMMAEDTFEDPYILIWQIGGIPSELFDGKRTMTCTFKYRKDAPLFKLVWA